MTTNDKLTRAPITKSDLLLAGWHNVYRDGNDEWHHPKLAGGGFTLAKAKAATRIYGVDKYGELNG